MNAVKDCTRRRRRFCGGIVGCVSLLLVFTVECRGSRVALDAPPEESVIGIRNSQVLPPHLLPQDVRNRDGYIHSYIHRSTDGGKTWSRLRIGAEDVPEVAEKTWTHTSRNVLELHDGTVIPVVSAGSSTDYLWRSKDKGQTWDKSLVCTVSSSPASQQLALPRMSRQPNRILCQSPAHRAAD